MESQSYSPVSGGSNLAGRLQIDLPARPIELIQEFNNFKRSSTPARFFRFLNGSWIELDRQVFDVLLQHFSTGRTTVEVKIGGICYLLDFLRMLQVNLDSSATNSIAWIDVEGSCFFPKVAVDGDCESISNKFEIEIRVKDGSFPTVACNSNVKAMDQSVVLDREQSGESSVGPEFSTSAGLGRTMCPGLMELSRGDKFYKAIERMFVNQMTRSGNEVVVTNIRKCSHSGLHANARLRAFQFQIQMMNAARGNARVKIGWYGASGMELPVIVAHGFGEPNSRLLGSEAFGVGFHLSDVQVPHLSSLLAEIDENNEKHLVLCRVITGNSERIEAGSKQFHPSSDEFDSGVDCIKKPNWYIVWSTSMNTHILPECIVSFKCSKQSQDSLKMMNSARKPAITNLSFAKLIAELGRALPSSMIQSVQISYNHFKRGRINKDTFIRSLRSLVGDKLLALSIRKIRGY